MNQASLRWKYWRVTGLLCLLVASFGSGAFAQSSQAEANRPFTLDGRTWASQQAFIESGLRCATRQVDDIEAEEIERGVQRFLNARGGPGSGGGSADAGPAARSAGTVTVPVYFHVIWNGTEGNVSDAEITQQIAVLNSSFSGANTGTLVSTGPAANTAFRFELVGTTLTNNPTWFTMMPGSIAEQQAKAALHQGNCGTLNIYSVKPGGGYLGWAKFPWQCSGNPTQDGIVIHYGSVPGGVDLSPYEGGDTATHEVGHWLGAYHTFQGGCSKSGDLVSDTPAERSPAYGCPVGRNTCPASGVDPIENFMDYSDDVCMYKFTPGQSSRMDLFDDQYRR